MVAGIYHIDAVYDVYITYRIGIWERSPLLLLYLTGIDIKYIICNNVHLINHSAYTHHVPTHVYTVFLNSRITSN